MAYILAVDDSKTIRELVKSILEDCGHKVDLADDGVNAMRLVRENQYDMIVSDINMPNMNGISLLTKLRNMNNYTTTPILMVTTEGDGYKKDKAKTTGASGWLQKPFDGERLCAAVNNLLAKRAA